jgi:hypothetical protein
MINLTPRSCFEQLGSIGQFRLSTGAFLELAGGSIANTKYFWLIWSEDVWPKYINWKNCLVLHYSSIKSYFGASAPRQLRPCECILKYQVQPRGRGMGGCVHTSMPTGLRYRCQQTCDKTTKVSILQMVPLLPGTR